jgi:hypothetical protein
VLRLPCASSGKWAGSIIIYLLHTDVDDLVLHCEMPLPFCLKNIGMVSWERYCFFILGVHILCIDSRGRSTLSRWL